MGISYQDFKAPLAVHVELTSACNHKCVHCYNYWRTPQTPIGTLAKDDLEQIIANLIENEVQDIVITGGEPLLFPDLVYQAIDQAQAGGIRCFLNTNLTLMSDEIAVEIRKRGVPILTSFPSFDPETFDKIVNCQGAFQRALNGIAIAQRHDIHITANMVVMQHNKDHVVKTGEFLHSLGITSFTATRVHPSATAQNFESLQLNPDQVVSVFDSLLYLRDKYGITIGTLTCYPMCLFGDMNKYGPLLLERSCTAGKTAGAIGADGGVRPCTHADEVYGNALDESLKDIWLKMKDWRDGSYIPEDCQDCAFVKRCGGGCRMDSKFFHKRKDQPDPYMVKENESKIVMPTCVEAASVEETMPLCVNPYLRYREETFGVYINTGDTLRLVTKDSANLLQSLSEKPFTLKELIQAKNLEPTETKTFFAELFKQKIVVGVEEMKQYTNTQV